MGFFDRRILTILKDGETRNFQQILSEVDFSQNTLRQHLDQLIDQDLIDRRKKPRRGPGRPQFIYGLSRYIDGRTPSALLNPYKGLVVLSFEKLQRLCRHEKGGYCKEIRG